MARARLRPPRVLAKILRERYSCTRQCPRSSPTQRNSSRCAETTPHVAAHRCATSASSPTARCSSMETRLSPWAATDEVADHELLRAKREPLDEIDCRGKIVLPGFVDSHTHPVFTTPRLIDFEKRIAGANYEEIAAAGGGIRASLRGVRESSTAELASHVLSALHEMAAQGTTTVEAKSGYGLSFEAEIKSLEAIADAARAMAGNGHPHTAGRARRRARVPRQSRRICPHRLRRHDSRRSAAQARGLCRRLLRAWRVQHGAVATYPAHRRRSTAWEFAPTSASSPPRSCPRFSSSIPRPSITWTSSATTISPRWRRPTPSRRLLPAANYFLGLQSFPPARKLIDAGVAVALRHRLQPRHRAHAVDARSCSPPPART